jgi:hypothetical protein
MRQSIRLRLSPLLLLLLLAGCTANRAPSDAVGRMRNGLDMFQNFRLEGIVEIHYGNLSFRKDIAIEQGDGALDVSVVDSGILGLLPTPLFHLHADSLITIRSSLPLGDNLSINGDWRNLPAKLRTTLLNKADSIAVSHVCVIDRVTFRFTDDLRIANIEYADFGVIVDYRSGEFHHFTVMKTHKPVASIQVDRVIRKANA